jgi:hypothetical protein
VKALTPHLALGLVLVSGAAWAQSAPSQSAPSQSAPSQSVSVPIAPGATAPVKPATPPAAPAAAIPASVPTAPSTDVQLQGGTVLTLRGLEKITGRPTNIVAPIGKPVNFATLTITARFCYSTPLSETPETAAFVQISDHRANQAEKPVFSGWMYASSPGLNGMEHPLYDVWVISCNNTGAPGSPVVSTSTAPVKVGSPDSSDKEQQEALPEDAGK